MQKIEGVVLLEIRRGDVWQVDFRTGYGSVQGGIRPAVIVQNNVGNFHSNTLLVVPFTTQKKTCIPTHRTIASSGSNGLSRDSILLAEQIMTIDKRQLMYKRGQLSFQEILDVNEAICISLDILHQYLHVQGYSKAG
jgi:mRNA interferase MazF